MPTANASGTLSGIAYIDVNRDGIHQSTELLLAGLSITLTGTTGAGAATATAEVNTDANGAFVFNNVMTGPANDPYSYHLTAAAMPGIFGTSATLGNVSALTGANVNSGPSGGGGSYTGGFDPQFISIRPFTADSTTVDYVPVPVGSGIDNANIRANSTPVLDNGTAIADVPLTQNSSQTLDLAGHFSDPDTTNSKITLNTSAGPLNIDLFDTTAPQTVANFFDYIDSGEFDSFIFSRDVTNFVLQGGGFKFDPATSKLVPTAKHAPVPNEFGASNTQYTIAMAKTPNQPNSATNQFFINLANNNTGANSLDTQNSGFTVFGKLDSTADQHTLANLLNGANNTINNDLDPNADLFNLPLKNFTGSNPPKAANQTTDATAANFLSVNGVTTVKRDEKLTYTVSSDHPELVTATLASDANEMLTLQATSGGGPGTATITVRATDKFGAYIITTFQVHVT